MSYFETKKFFCIPSIFVLIFSVGCSDVEFSDTPQPEKTSAAPDDLNTGNDSVDDNTDQVQDALDDLANKDDRFKDIYGGRGSQFLIDHVTQVLKFNIFLEKRLVENPLQCQLDVDAKLGLLRFANTDDIEIGRCQGFIDAKSIRAARGSACTPKTTVTFSASLIRFGSLDISLNLDADCKCYSRVHGNLISLLSTTEVHSFGRPEACAREFPDVYRNP